MTDRKIRIADAELAILEVLWEQAGATIRQITAKLYPGGTVSEYATVQKLLGRLEAKGCVSRDASGFAHVFRASMDRPELIGRRLEEVAEKLCDGSLVPLLMHLTRAANLSRDQRDALRQLLDETP